eukprot:363351-Chlamydomonas_euryale.AAC.9
MSDFVRFLHACGTLPSWYAALAVRCLGGTRGRCCVCPAVASSSRWTNFCGGKSGLAEARPRITASPPPHAQASLPRAQIR